MLGAINAHLYGMKSVRVLPFDGVRGTLPDWVPDPLRQEFTALQSALLMWYRNYSGNTSPTARWYVKASEELLRYMASARGAYLSPGRTERKYHSGSYPPEIEDKLDSLIYIKRLVDVGAEHGNDAAIAAYLGKSGQQVHRGVVMKERAREIASNPRPGRHVVPDDVIRGIAGNLTAAGKRPRELEAAVRAVLEKRGMTAPSKPTLRNQLTRLGYRARKES